MGLMNVIRTGITAARQQMDTESMEKSSFRIQSNLGTGDCRVLHKALLGWEEVPSEITGTTREACEAWIATRAWADVETGEIK